MTRTLVYSLALVAFVASTAMIVASIAQTDWIFYYVRTPKGDTVTVHVGLHERCFSTHDPPCKPYPPPQMCEGTTGQWFCSVWKTVGFLATFSTILCLAGLVCFLVVIKGGKYRRETGWPLISGMLTLVALIQFAVLIAVWYLYEHDDQFTIPGWHLGASWDISLASAILSLATAVGLTVSAYLLPPEEGYEFLEDDVDA